MSSWANAVENPEAEGYIGQTRLYRDVLEFAQLIEIKKMF
jgi:hypothetical protein